MIQWSTVHLFLGYLVISAALCCHDLCAYDLTDFFSRRDEIQYNVHSCRMLHQFTCAEIIKSMPTSYSGMFLEILTLSRESPISLNSDSNSEEGLTSSPTSALTPIRNGQLRSPGQLGGTAVLQDIFQVTKWIWISTKSHSCSCHSPSSSPFNCMTSY